MKITDEVRRAVYSEMGKNSQKKIKETFLNPESPSYDPDYFKKIRRGEKISNNIKNGDGI